MIKHRKHYSILLVEDNEINQKLAAGVLEREGHLVTIAGNGREAVDNFENLPFDLILMDVQMPEMNGYEATTVIREKEKKTGTHIPIIALTGLSMRGIREKCLESGMDAYLKKPFNIKVLLSLIEEIISRNS